jgi:hypothetical protein
MHADDDILTGAETTFAAPAWRSTCDHAVGRTVAARVEDCADAHARRLGDKEALARALGER